MSLKHGLLGLLNYLPMSGYELCKKFDESLGFFWQVHHSQIYKELKQLEREGLLDAERIIQGNKPNKTNYCINQKGKDELMKWLNTMPIINDIMVKHSFLMKTFFSGEKDIDENIAMLEEYKKMRMKFMETSKKYNPSVEKYKELVGPEKSLYWYMTAEFGIRNAEFSVKWADDCIAMLKDLKKRKS